jgi:hypothetical protein
VNLYRKNAIDDLNAEMAKQSGSKKKIRARFNTILDDKLWLKRKSHAGTYFTSFSDFVFAPSPSGLGARDQAKFEDVRSLLLIEKQYGLLAECLMKVTRARGRPRKTNITTSDIFEFRTISRSLTAVDRMLLTLQRLHPEVFEKVCAQELSPLEAARRVGIVAVRNPPKMGKSYRFGVDMEAISKIRPRAQKKFLPDVFHLMSLDAQCALLTRVIEPLAGPGITERWRAARLAQLGQRPRPNNTVSLLGTK